jgi:hypothetical protein
MSSLDLPGPARLRGNAEATRGGCAVARCGCSRADEQGPTLKHRSALSRFRLRTRLLESGQAAATELDGKAVSPKLSPDDGNSEKQLRQIPANFDLGNPKHMDSSLHEVWKAASGRPFVPAIGKDNQFLFAFLLVVLGLGLSGAFALSTLVSPPPHNASVVTDKSLDRSFVNVPLLGVPASLALAYAPPSLRFLTQANDGFSLGVVYMFCAVGVYV